jgi:asparagine synthase (glutamine-hydrolysing)
MCGISGFRSFNIQNNLNFPVIRQMTDRISHRGPDDAGYFTLDEMGVSTIYQSDDLPENGRAQIAFGHRRLSILDLSSLGHQPMSSDDGRVTITLNGEIYNYLELRDELRNMGYNFVSESDTEVALYSYHAWGTECFKKFNGMWALAIFDSKNGDLILCRDRMGKKPLFYFQNEDFLIFSSEIKSLFEHTQVPKKANLKKIVNYAGRHYRYVDVDNETFFQNVMQVPKASYMTIDQNGTIDQKEYWSVLPSMNTPDAISQENAVAKLKYLLKDAVELRMRSDVPVGLYLSGGLDSTSIAAMMVNSNDNVQSFSGVTGKGYFDETEYIEALVDAKNIKSTFIYPKPDDLFSTLREMLEFHDEPICTITWYSNYLINKEVANTDIKVILTGHGGDELFAGYWDHYHYFFNDIENDKAKLKHEVDCWKVNYNRDYNELDRQRTFIDAAKINRGMEVEKYSQYMNCISPELIAYTSSDDLIFDLDGVSELSRRLYLELMFETIPVSLRAEDRNFMAFSTENRVPFLDYRLIEFAFSLPNEYKIKNGFGKFILREAMDDILPDKIRLRKDKVGFNAPADEWFRGQNKADILLLLSRKGFVNSQIYNITAVKDVFERHLAGENHYMFLWQFINIHLWWDANFQE